ncbi:MAG: NAD(P)H-hydrate epimerase [bacterium]|nr:NAD(P)H-hydrate epimerase [bacterium]
MEKIFFNSLPLLTTEQLRKTDQIMVDHYQISVTRMMECAGLRFAELTRYYIRNILTNKNSRILILAGKGHNGGDGFVTARHLSNWGLDVTVLLSAPASQLTSMPLEQLNIIRTMPVNIFDINSRKDIKELFIETDLILDCLLGFGIKGAPASTISEYIKITNKSNRPVLSLDTPSGLNTTTGEVYDPCIKAVATLSLAMLKTGFKTKSAQSQLGTIYLGDIGVPYTLYEKINIRTGSIFSGSSIVEVSSV